MVSSWAFLLTHFWGIDNARTHTINSCCIFLVPVCCMFAFLQGVAAESELLLRPTNCSKFPSCFFGRCQGRTEPGYLPAQPGRSRSRRAEFRRRVTVPLHTIQVDEILFVTFQLLFTGDSMGGHTLSTPAVTEPGLMGSR